MGWGCCGLLLRGEFAGCADCDLGRNEPERGAWAGGRGGVT